MTPDPSGGPAGKNAPGPDHRLPVQLRVAAGIVAAQGLAGVGVAAFLLVRALGAGPEGAAATMRFGEVGYFAVIGAALLAVAIGLARGRRWARTPAIVAQLLLLPVVYSLLGPSRQPLLGAAALLVVGSAFLLLLSEPVRRWWMAD